MIDLGIRVRTHGLYLGKLQRVDCALVKEQSIHAFRLHGIGTGWLSPNCCGIWRSEGTDEYRHRGCAVLDTFMER